MTTNETKCETIVYDNSDARNKNHNNPSITHLERSLVTTMSEIGAAQSLKAELAAAPLIMELDSIVVRNGIDEELVGLCQRVCEGDFDYNWSLIRFYKMAYSVLFDYVENGQNRDSAISSILQIVEAMANELATPPHIRTIDKGRADAPSLLSVKNDNEIDRVIKAFNDYHAGLDLNCLYEPVAADQALFLVQECEDKVIDGEFETALALIQEALRINPCLRLSHDTLRVLGFTYSGMGDWSHAAECFLAFCKSALGQMHRERGAVATEMVNVAQHLQDTDSVVAANLFEQAGIIGESLMQRMKAAFGLAKLWTKTSPTEALRVVESALIDDGWERFARKNEELTVLHKELQEIERELRTTTPNA